MPTNTTKLIEVLDVQAGKTKTTDLYTENGNEIVTSGTSLMEQAPYPLDFYGQPTVDPRRVSIPLTEAALGALQTDNFPDLLRMGVRFDVFGGYNETATVYEGIVKRIPSTKHQEEYQDDAGLGVPPIVLEGQDYPTVAVSIGGGKIIPNYKRGFLIEVSEEIQRFDMSGKVRDTANQIGRAMRVGRDQAVMNVLTTTTNYNVLNLNDQAGNNTQTLTFSPINLNLALALMVTQKDRISGQYLGVAPQVLVIGPLLERFARTLISSPEMMRVGGNTTNDVYGQGTGNPFFGAVSKIIVSPRFGASYQWALIDPFRLIYFQEVEGLQVLTEAGNMTSETWLKRDVIRYKARDWYGVGMRDDRYGFYSDSTTAPIAS